MNRHDFLEHLAQRISEIEITHHPTCAFSSLPGLDGFLPASRLSGGSLVELISKTEGDGSWTLALWMAKRACANSKALVIADGEGFFYPPAVPWLDWKRCIIVRPRLLHDVYVAVEHTLRCSAVGAVVSRASQLSVPIARRLQFAAEAGGGIGFILRSAAALDNTGVCKASASHHADCIHGSLPPTTSGSAALPGRRRGTVFRSGDRS